MTYDIVLSKDSSVRLFEPNRNYGDSNSFYVNKISNDEFESLIQFDTSGIDEHNGVFAELRMYQYSSASGGTIDINRITETWDESTVTWNNKPTFDTNELKIYSYGNGWTDIGIKQIIATFIDGTLTNYGFYLRNISILDDTVSYRSSDYSENRPHVRIYEHSDYAYNYTTPNFDWYDGNPYYTTLNAYVEQLETTQSDPYETRFNIRTPWSSTIHEEFLDEGETVTYTQSGSGYTEYYTVEYVFTTYDNEIGYNPVMKAYWYRDYDDSYVSLDGDDDNNGFDWDNAYRTVTKGTTEVKDGSTVYIDDGVYGNETSPFPNNKSCNFELRNSMATITASNDVIIGDIDTADTYQFDGINFLILDTQSKYKATNNVSITNISLSFYNLSRETIYKAVVLEEVSTGIYEIMDISSEFTIDDTSNTDYIPINIEMQSNQYIAIHCNDMYVPYEILDTNDGTMYGWGNFYSPFYGEPAIGNQYDVSDADFSPTRTWEDRSNLGVMVHGVEI